MSMYHAHSISTHIPSSVLTHYEGHPEVVAVKDTSPWPGLQ